MLRLRFVGILAIAVLACAPVAAQHGTKDGQWRSYNGDPGSTKYAPLDQINKTNVTSLRIVWRRPAVAPSLNAKAPALKVAPNFRATPIMVDGTLYAPNGVGLAEAFDPSTGATRWVQERSGSGQDYFSR